MKINVTQDDIDKGKPLNCAQCPVARAIKRVVKPWVSVQVGDDGKICVAGAYFSAPESAIDFISAFDRRRPVSPFSFELPIERYAK